jgi:hypothetical protein
MARPKTNVTLKLDADLLREARVIAAEGGLSMSALVTDHLESLVRERKAFERARRRALARLRKGLDLHWTPAAPQHELHERWVLRRRRHSDFAEVPLRRHREARL